MASIVRRRPSARPRGSRRRRAGPPRGAHAAYDERQLFMKALRSSPFLPVASALHFFIFSCCVIGVAGAAAPPAERQAFMNALRSSPFLPTACLLQSPILVCCAVIGALAGVSAANAEAENAIAKAAAMQNSCFMRSPDSIQ